MGRGLGSPPHGIPIPESIHEQYPDEVKEAWATFDAWWKQLQGPAHRSDMPAEVVVAMETILAAPIPVYEGVTGADSCYMIAVQAQLLDD